jgi:hypothetical protein
MGERSGVWALDVDTAEDHDDGVAAWTALAGEHEPIVTREHRSATGGPHLYFAWSSAIWIGCSNGDLPAGISVKGQGGYVVAPPSRRKGRSYTVHKDLDPIEAPKWLLDLVLQGRSPTAQTPRSGELVNLTELADILHFVPNNDLSWEEWTSIGLAIYAASDGQGFELFDAFSQKSDKYDAEITRERWNEIAGSPPNRTGIGKLRKIARANGWAPKLYAAEPRHPAPTFTNAEEARQRIEQVWREFLYDVECPRDQSNAWRDYGALSRSIIKTLRPDPDEEDEVPADARAMCVDPGIGKTRIGIKEISDWIAEVGGIEPVVYAVPQHKLSPK